MPLQAGRPSRPPARARGQVLVLVAITFVVLMGFVGLVTDVGQLYIQVGHLKKAVDAAALAAAGQYREGRSIAEMTDAANEVMALNNVDTGEIQVSTCENTPGDLQLCPTPPRKLVRVTAHLEAATTFLRLVGVETIPVESSTIAEAASMDVVLVIDISESMSWDAAVGQPLRDPSFCNEEDVNPGDPGGTMPGSCQPFEEVKRAAIAFVNRILDKPEAQEQDRIAIITFSNGNNGVSNDPNYGTRIRSSGWTFSRTNARTIIENLEVFEAGTCFDPSYKTAPAFNNPAFVYGPCRLYRCEDPTSEWCTLGSGCDPVPTNPDCDPDDIRYSGMNCLSCRQENWPTPPFWTYELSALPTTNIGGGLLLAGNMFALQTRESALWVVVLLSDGMANATDLEATDRINDYSTYPVGFCSDATRTEFPLCVDWDASTRHTTGDADYDAEDYARDMADFVGCMPTNPAVACNGVAGQGAIAFTVGLGDGVLDTTNEVNGVPYGAALLRYIARVGFSADPDPATDPCTEFDEDGDYSAWCGNYYFSPTGSQLLSIFEDIASRIFTRLVR